MALATPNTFALAAIKLMADHALNLSDAAYERTKTCKSDEVMSHVDDASICESLADTLIDSYNAQHADPIGYSLWRA